MSRYLNDVLINTYQCKLKLTFLFDNKHILASRSIKLLFKVLIKSNNHGTIAYSIINVIKRDIISINGHISLNKTFQSLLLELIVLTNVSAMQSLINCL